MTRNAMELMINIQDPIVHIKEIYKEDNLHIHIVWNVVNYHIGRKWHMSKSEAREIINRIIEMWENI